MKKMISLLLIGAMTASVLGGCAVPAGTASPAPAAQEADDGAGAEDADDFAGGTLVMATNAEFPPYEFYDGSEVVGIDAEIAKAIADDLGMTLQIEDMNFDSIIASVQSGKADIGAYRHHGDPATIIFLK